MCLDCISECANSASGNGHGTQGMKVVTVTREMVCLLA